MPKHESKSLPVIQMCNHLLEDTDMIVIKTFIDGSSSLWGTTTFYWVEGNLFTVNTLKTLQKYLLVLNTLKILICIKHKNPYLFKFT